MRLRIMSLGCSLGLLALTALGFLSPAESQAAYQAGNWSSHASYGRRPQFRPAGRRAPVVSSSRWRPQSVTEQRTLMQARRPVQRGTSFNRYQRRQRSGQKQLLSQRRVARKAVPILRSRDGVSQFRPTSRFGGTEYGQVIDPPYGREAQGSMRQLHSQFRPLQPQRKRKTYEELNAQQQRRPVDTQVLPYPVHPAGLPTPMDGYLPSWR